jgi:hypothetical protein
VDRRDGDREMTFHDRAGGRVEQAGLLPNDTVQVGSKDCRNSEMRPLAHLYAMD